MIKKIELRKYPGRVTKSLREAVKWLNRRKKTFLIYEDDFDFPDYWGMPRKIVCRLSSSDVDFIQEHTHNWHKDPYNDESFEEMWDF